MRLVDEAMPYLEDLCKWSVQRRSWPCASVPQSTRGMVLNQRCYARPEHSHRRVDRQVSAEQLSLPRSRDEIHGIFVQQPGSH